MERTLTKKKVAIYMAIPLALRSIILVLRWLLATNLVDKFTEYQQTKQVQLINNIIYLGCSVITFALIMLFGYLLTKNRKKALIFTGSAFFGVQVANIGSSLINRICDVLTNMKVLETQTATVVNIVCGLAFVVVDVAIGVLVFTAIEGMNDKYTAPENPMTLRHARIRFIIAYVIMFAISNVVVSAPSYLYGILLDSVEAFDSLQGGYLMSAISAVASFISTVISFAIVYLAGYKKNKNHNEGIRLYSALSLATPLTSFVSLFISVVASALVLILTPVVPAGTDYMAVAEEQMMASSKILQITNTVSLITVPLVVVLSLWALKLYFDNKTVTVEAEPELQADTAGEIAQ